MDGISRNDWLERAVGDWPFRQVLTGSIAITLALGLFLAARRLNGALHSPLPPSQLVVAATLLLAWTLVVRTILPRRFATWLPAAVLLLFAVGCSFPGQRAVDWLVWLPVFGAFVASHNAIAIAPAKRRTSPADTQQVFQQFTRCRTPAGHDVIHGTLRAEFAPGQRTTTLYVAFCPPFERLPNVELESTADAKVVQTLHNGAQLEVRLPRPAKSPYAASVEIFATDAD
jgi:hypothetical protein